jgi:hypothetical protein
MICGYIAPWVVHSAFDAGILCPMLTQRVLCEMQTLCTSEHRKHTRGIVIWGQRSLMESTSYRQSTTNYVPDEGGSLELLSAMSIRVITSFDALRVLSACLEQRTQPGTSPGPLPTCASRGDTDAWVQCKGANSAGHTVLSRARHSLAGLVWASLVLGSFSSSR